MNKHDLQRYIEDAKEDFRLYQKLARKAQANGENLKTVGYLIEAKKAQNDIDWAESELVFL